MRALSKLQRLRSLMAAFFVTSGWAILAQRYQEVEPQLFRFQVSSSSVGVYSEGIWEHVDQPTYSSTYHRFFIGPVVSLAFGGSLYHPNLFQYEFSGDYTPGWAWDHTTSTPGSTLDRSQFEALRNLSGNAVLFENKPFAPVCLPPPVIRSGIMIFSIGFSWTLSAMGYTPATTRDLFLSMSR
jgi:hypothetical protein